MTEIPFHKQIYRHDPDNGIYGDCYRTAIACLLGVDPLEVPHFLDGGRQGGSGMRDAGTWLAERGLSLIKQIHPGSIDDLPRILMTVAGYNTGAHYMLTGRSSSGCNHAVICRNHQIVWDPSIDDVGIVGPCFGDAEFGFIVEFLGVLRGVTAVRQAV
jgi:hypothetical protein